MSVLSIEEKAEVIAFVKEQFNRSLAEFSGDPLVASWLAQKLKAAELLLLAEYNEEHEDSVHNPFQEVLLELVQIFKNAAQQITGQALPGLEISSLLSPPPDHCKICGTAIFMPGLEFCDPCFKS